MPIIKIKNFLLSTFTPLYAFKCFFCCQATVAVGQSTISFPSVRRTGEPFKKSVFAQNSKSRLYSLLTRSVPVVSVFTGSPVIFHTGQSACCATFQFLTEVLLNYSSSLGCDAVPFHELFF